MRLGLGTDISVGYRQPLFGRVPFLLDTYTGAAAAYSLRQLRTGVTNVVRVRRSSDNAEANFTAAEVADGTMTAWVNTDVVQYTSDFTSGNEDLNESNGTGTDGETIAGVSDAYKLTLSGGNVLHQAIKGGFNSNNLFSISFEYYIPSSNSKVDNIIFGFVGGTTSTTSTLDSWTTISVDSYNSAGGGNLFFRARDGIVITIDADGDVFYLKNIVVTQTTADGHVVTWYDQSGNGNDATQATAASQPKIVDSGVLVEENGKAAMQFNSKYLVTSSFSALSTYTFFDVVFANNTNQFIRDGISATNRSAIYIISTTRYSRGFGASSAYTNNIQSLYTTIASGSSTELAQNGSSFQSLSADSDSLTGIKIGVAFDNVTLPFLGKYQELILYPSDQSANRTAIEQNINDHYSIYP